MLHLSGPLGTPIFPPNYGDPDLTSEQIEDWEKQYDDAMKDAVWESSELSRTREMKGVRCEIHRR